MTQPKARAFMTAITDDYASFDSLLAACKKLPNTYEWALITHDLDDTAKHYHVALKTPTPTTPNAIAAKLDTKPNFVQMWRGSTGNMWAYLPHNTKTAADEKADYNHYLQDPTKFATNLTDTTVFNYDAAKKNGAKNAQLEQTIKHILTGQITLKDLLHQDNIVYYHEHYNKLNKAIQLRTQSLKYNPPNCKTIYIQGNSGTGKTNYATEYATEHYPNNWAFASAGNDPLQDYTGEKCLILDDWRPKDYELQDLLAMLDPYHRTRTHKSRYFNKPLATELIIITSNMTADDAIHYYTGYNSEDPKQLRRRIQTILTIHDDHTTTKEEYDEQLDGWRQP